AQLVTPARDSGASVKARDLRVARAAVAALPRADRALLARHGLTVELVPAAGLDQGMLGATSIVRRGDGRWTPTRIRVATHISDKGEHALAHVVRHEIGHALAVLRRQDRSEDAAHE